MNGKELQLTGLAKAGERIKAFVEDLKWVDKTGKSSIDRLKQIFNNLVGIAKAIGGLIKAIFEPIETGLARATYEDTGMIRGLIVLAQTATAKILSVINKVVYTIKSLQAEGQYSRPQPGIQDLSSFWSLNVWKIDLHLVTIP